MFAVWTECAAQAGEQGRARGTSISFPGCLPSGSTPCDVLLFPSCFLPLVTNAFSYRNPWTFLALRAALKQISWRGFSVPNVLGAQLYMDFMLDPRGSWRHPDPTSLSLLPPFALGASSSLAGQGWKTWFLNASILQMRKLRARGARVRIRATSADSGISVLPNQTLPLSASTSFLKLLM